MYVCICNQVTDREIKGAAALGVSTLDELAETLGVGTCCGRCRECAQQVLCASNAAQATAVPVVVAQPVQFAALSRCSSSGPRAIMDTRDPAVANDQQTELVA
ncbi:(2Fe-2S)-binding protein [Paracidovorax citrulli]